MVPGVIAAGSNRAARHLWIFALWVSAPLIFWPILKEAIGLALSDDRYLQILLGPLVCFFLIFRQRTEIFANARYAARPGIPLLLLAMLTGLAAVYRERGSETTGLAAGVLAIVFLWMAVFFLCYGAESFRAALYPLCCLFLAVPLPAVWMDRIATGLQHGSATVSYQILRLSGIPVFRRGTAFSLPGLDFEVAPECSGIRSSLTFLVIAIIAAYVYLRSGWARCALILLTIPIALFKNAVRIVAITTLAAYVDRIFIDGPFHHTYGGLLFSAAGVAIFVPVLAGLQAIERRWAARSGSERS